MENIDHDISDNVKAGILNRSLPENLRFINVFQYKNNWSQLCDYVKNLIPDIVFSNMKESVVKEETNRQIFSATSIFKIKIKVIKSKHTLSTKKQKHNQKKGMEDATTAVNLVVIQRNVGTIRKIIETRNFLAKGTNSNGINTQK